MAYEKPRIINVKGRNIQIAHLELPTHPLTYLTADAAAAATSLTVLDNVGFVQNYPILVGNLGSNQTEIKKVNAAVTAGTSLTSTGLTFAHSVGAPVRRILFDQWKIYGNSTNSTSGATLVATVDMQVDAAFTNYVNTGTEYNYYFALPYDSLNTVTGDSYSDGVANSGAYSSNMVGALINSALDATKSKLGGIITLEWCMREINDCLRFMTGKLKRWSFLQSYNYVLSQAQRGLLAYSLPSDIEDANSPKSILDVRIGGEEGLVYWDKKQWEIETRTLIYTTIRTSAIAGDTSLLITNSYDFPDYGSVNVYVSGTKYTVTYTGVTRSATTGVLTGVPASGTGSITVGMASGLNVFVNQQEGIPRGFSVWDGYLYIYPMVDATYDNANIYLDYNTSRTAVDSAGDTIEGPRYDAVKHWLAWKLRCQNNSSGQLDPNDGDHIMFREILTDLVRKEISGQKYRMKPRVNSIDYGAGRRQPQVLSP